MKNQQKKKLHAILFGACRKKKNNSNPCFRQNNKPKGITKFFNLSLKKGAKIQICKKMCLR